MSTRRKRFCHAKLGEALVAFGEALKEAELARVNVEEQLLFQQRLLFEQKKYDEMLVEREKERKMKVEERQRQRQKEFDQFKAMKEVASRSIADILKHARV